MEEKLISQIDQQILFQAHQLLNENEGKKLQFTDHSGVPQAGIYDEGYAIWQALEERNVNVGHLYRTDSEFRYKFSQLADELRKSRAIQRAA